MYYVKHGKNAGQRRGLCLILCIALFAVLAVFMGVNMQLRRIIADSARVHAQNMFSQAVSDAVNEALCDSRFDPVQVTKSDSGQVVSIQTDTAQINMIRSQLSIILLDKLGEMSDQPVEVSLGTLSGIDALAGLGPKIEMHFELRGGIAANIASDLIETGINQSLHTIDCIVSANFFVILPGYRFSAELNCSVPLAQSVIVGDVPDAYTYVVGDQSDTISRIFDYGHLEP